ncbi:APC family permease [Staphylococcus pseudintermedius]|uniref:APC family permease n=1 Tax=Staphylococcus pseudintermedius TaxID=283734 RepID=UPI000CBA3458|nr:APC family permease [Staphylococcus pseudintermedius]PPD63268.1 amino acid permease [Staphylococcus pseudintermedius]
MKKLGFWSIVLLSINSIIGSGIFLTPGSVIRISGIYTPLIYVMAAIFASILALTFASASKYVNKSGAAYSYTMVALGPHIGFYVGITRFIAGSIAWGVMATAVVKTVITIFGGDHTDARLITLGFILLMGILLLINVLGKHLLVWVSNLSTIGKIAALLTVIISGLYLVIQTGDTQFSHISTLVDTSQIDSQAFVMAIIAAFYAFTGFESIATGAQDMKSPEKNLPRAIPLAIFMIAFIYIGVISITMTINPVALIQTKEVVSLVAVFDTPVIHRIILYGSLISMFGINVAASFSTPRIIEAIAHEGQIPKWFKKRTVYDFPLPAFMLTFLIAIAIPLAFQYNLTSIILLSSISRFIQYLIVPICVILFYYGKTSAPTLNHIRKNFFTDVLLPIFSFVLTLVLLIKFNWKGQFLITNDAVTSFNYLGVASLVLSYVIFPIILYRLTPLSKKESTQIPRKMT